MSTTTTIGRGERLHDLKKGVLYNVTWIDGDIKTKCRFIQKHRNFYIFHDENGMKVICRPESVKSIIETPTQQ